MGVVREVEKDSPYATNHDELTERGAKLGQKELDKITQQDKATVKVPKRRE